MLIQMTRKEALELGLLVCKHCGYPPNNHFKWGKKKCAHSDKCPGYEDRARRGKILK